MARTNDEKTKELLLNQVRSRASKLLSELEAPPSSDEIPTDNRQGKHRSWVRGHTENKPSKQCQFFDQHGFLHMKSFATPTEISSMKEQMKRLVEEHWNPGREETAVFRTDEKQMEAQGSSDYFLDSSNNVHYFAENDALDKNGSLKPEFEGDKMAALNKSGHGMHTIPGAFQKYATSAKIRSLVNDLGWNDPVIPQSMYIFKQPRIGGEVTSHQDSTFLFTEPKQTCLGLWLALDDATLENGCLWLRPKSHWEELRRKFIRNPDYFECQKTSEPQMIFQVLDPNKDRIAPWEGKLPENSLDGLFDVGFVPVECKAGDLLVFTGTLDHLSLPNASESPRHTFQLHLVEGEKEGVNWAESNWLQYPDGTSFLRIAD